MQARANLQWSYQLIDGLAKQGAGRAVIAPGSRSTPLALACERHTGIETWIQVDERCAGFFALGLAAYDLKPVILIATSGSAPAHWYPAVIEADQRHLPLILLSADRPPELQGWHANQTTDQSHLFGRHVRAYYPSTLPEPGRHSPRLAHALGARAGYQALWPNPGPVHINQPFREPLVPTGEDITELQPGLQANAATLPELKLDHRAVQQASEAVSGRPGLIVCGPAHPDRDFNRAVAELAQRLRCPVLADPLSGVRFGPHVKSAAIMARYDAFLRDPGACSIPAPEWVLRFGCPPVSKVLLEYLASLTDATHLLVPRGADWPDPLHLTARLIQGCPVEFCRRLLAAGPEPAAHDLSSALQEAEREADPPPVQQRGDERPFEGAVISELLAALPPESLLFCGNSLPIRQVDTWSGTSTKPLRLTANRGVSGIDGQVSTVLGLSAASAGRHPVVALLGDLALYHDMNGLLAARTLDATLIVINNGGGGIFAYLPQAHLPEFERHWLTPTGLDLALVARLYRLGYRRVERQAEFAPALTESLRTPGVRVIEVLVDREESLRRHRGYWEGLLRQLQHGGTEGATARNSITSRHA